MHRLFIAVDVPLEIKTEIQRIQQILRKHDLFSGRYTAPEFIHITLKFIGEVQPAILSHIQKKLEKLSVSRRTARLGSVDVFNTQKINIIFVHVIAPVLIELTQKINQHLSAFTENEFRPFIPHLTLARAKTVYDENRLLKLIDTIQVKPLEWEVCSFVLKESELDEQGATYRDIQKYMLKSE